MPTFEDLDPKLWCDLPDDVWQIIKTYMLRPSMYANITMYEYDHVYYECLSCAKWGTRPYKERGLHKCNNRKYRKYLQFCNGFELDTYTITTRVNGSINKVYSRECKKYNIGGGIYPCRFGTNLSKLVMFFIRYRVYPNVVICDTYNYLYNSSICLKQGYVRETCVKVDTLNSTFVINRATWDRIKLSSVKETSPTDKYVVWCGPGVKSEYNEISFY
jgi:hypothetical protein